MTFSPPRTSANNLYANYKLFKIFDLVKLMKILYVHKFLNQNLPTDILNSLSINKVDHSLGTRSDTKSLLRYQSVNTTFFGLNSLSRLSSHQWNLLQLNNSKFNLSEISLSPSSNHSHLNLFSRLTLTGN